MSDKTRVCNRMEDDLARQIKSYQSELENYLECFSEYQIQMITELIRLMQEIQRSFQA